MKHPAAAGFFMEDNRDSPHNLIDKEGAMRNALLVLAFIFTLGLVSMDADAARRFGGGGNLGKQRAAPMKTETPAAAPATAPPASTAAAPAKPAQAAPAAAPAAKPSFMSRWGGLLAGLGIGALLASMFGAQMGPIIGALLMALALGGVAFLLYRLFAGRKNANAEVKPRPLQFAGIGAAVPGAPAQSFGGGAAPSTADEEAPVVRSAAPAALADSEIEPFLRVAKTSFIRLQAANDAGDLDDIRDYTTPEMYAEIAMQVQDRAGAAQKTEVVSVNPSLVESVVEGDHAIASVRFTGLMRENDAPNPVPFDEIWHVRKNLKDRKGSWMIMGIQQAE
jgi:predicted lipid-binding transport protein (Tim44 family)